MKLIKQGIYCLKLLKKISEKGLKIRLFICLVLPLIGVITSYLDRNIINEIAKGKTAIRAICILCIVRLAVEILEMILGHISLYVTFVQEKAIQNYIQNSVVEKSTSSDISVFDDRSYYDKLLFTQSNFHAMISTIWCIIDGISAFITLCTIIFMFSKYSIIMCIVIILSSLPYAFVARKYSMKRYECEMDCLSDQRKASYWVELGTRKEFSEMIRLYDLGPRIIDKYNVLWDKVVRREKKIEKSSMYESILFSIIPKVVIAGVTFYITIQILYEDGSIGDYALYTALSMQLLNYTKVVFQTVNNFLENQMILETVEEFEEKTVKNIKSGNKMLRSIESISFQNVSFNYPSMKKKVLDNISFEVGKGEKFVIVGSNGSGKSTITKLLLRFYDVSEGEILINGVNIKEYNLQSLRGEFAVYFQNELNFCSSIEDNISLFSDEIDSDSMNDVVDNFDLETIVKKGDEKLGFKQELYKRFEENGIEVSGGENQRIALARALYQNGSCIVLDEHTSAMDFIHMNKANKFIQNKYKDKIVIIITHKMDDFFDNAKFLFVNNGVCKNISNKEIEQYMVEEVGL